MMYTRVHTGAQIIIPYLKALIDKNITLIDYEKIRDESDQMLVGSSKLAGTVGMFNVFRLVGEQLLLTKNLNTPFLYSGGSAYMHQDKQSCELALKKIDSMIREQGGLPKEISPFVIGISGRGIVSDGAKELLEQNLTAQNIPFQDLKNLINNPPEESNQKIYYTVISRENYLKRRDQGKFDSKHYDSQPDEYESVIHTEVLPYLSVLVNCNNWQKGSKLFLTKDQIKQYALSYDQPKLLAISDIAALINGPIEFFKEECKIENPYFLYDMENDMRYETFQELNHSQNSLKKIISYLGVEQLPAELPIDASKMFSDKLESYAYDILVSAQRTQEEGLDFEEAWNNIPEEIQKSISTTYIGQPGKHYDYLKSLL